jgi:hypothetical protein
MFALVTAAHAASSVVDTMTAHRLQHGKKNEAA